MTQNKRLEAAQKIISGAIDNLNEIAEGNTRVLQLIQQLKRITTNPIFLPTKEFGSELPEVMRVDTPTVAPIKKERKKKEPRDTSEDLVIATSEDKE